MNFKMKVLLKEYTHYPTEITASFILMYGVTSHNILLLIKIIIFLKGDLLNKFIFNDNFQNSIQGLRIKYVNTLIFIVYGRRVMKH
jgi:hypothetical protein